MGPFLELGSTLNFLGDQRREEEENFSYAMQLVSSSVLSMSLQCAFELGVFDMIAKAGDGAKLSSAEIVAQLPATNPQAPDMLDRVLKLLASHSVLDCSVVQECSTNGSNVQRLYSLNPVSKYFVTNEDGVSLGPWMVLLQDKITLETWPQLKNAILEGGISFNRAHGKHSFEYLSSDSRVNHVFNAAMYNKTTIVLKNILKFYKGFEHITQLVDVGGSLGVTLNQITSKYPHIKGINFDLSHVIEHAPFFPGVEHVSGDMFERIPTGDAIIMKSILHDWSDEHCLKILKNCYKAIPENGKVIVVEPVYPAKPETSATVKSTSQADVLMMTQNPGGKERSQQEFLALAIGAGFSGIKFECFVCGLWVMEFYK